jgi:DNA-binding LytR/AlgR family response regulator
LRIVLCIAFDKRASPRAIAEFRSGLIESENNLHSVETTGAFDFMLEITAPDMAWYSNWLASAAQPLAKLVTRCEASFICKRFIRRPEEEMAIWVPCERGMKRIDSSLIDKISAEGDYVRVHSQGKSWLLHSTLCSVLERLSMHSFVRIHRSIVVRCDFIDHLIHEDRHWVAELHDGSRERVARSHIADTLAALKPHSSAYEQASSKSA